MKAVGFLTVTLTASNEAPSLAAYLLGGSVVLLLLIPFAVGLGSRGRAGAATVSQLAARDRSEFEGRWRLVEAHYRIHPRLTLAEADRVVRDLFRFRGLPEFGSPLADRFREPHATVEAEAAGCQVGDYRISQAMSDLRSLKDDLLPDRGR